jgi:hypothetical protein
MRMHASASVREAGDEYRTRQGIDDMEFVVVRTTEGDVCHDGTFRALQKMGGTANGIEPPYPDAGMRNDQSAFLVQGQAVRSGKPPLS